MKTQTERIPISLRRALELWLPYALVIVMMSCFGWFAALLVYQIVGVSAWYLTWLALLVALEALFNIQRRRQQKLNGIDNDSPWLDLAVEWLAIALVLKFGPYLWSGLDRLWLDLQAWQQDFVMNFFTMDYVLTLLLAGIVWGQIYLYDTDFQGLSGDEQKMVDEDEVHTQRSQIRQRLAGRFMWIGLVITAVSGLFTPPEWVYEFSTAFWNAPLPANDMTNGRVALWPILLYFLSGLLLLSLVNLSVWRAVWAWEKTPLVSDLWGRWLGYSLLTLGVVLILALLMPSGSIAAFFASLSYILNWIVSAVYALIFLLMLPFIALLGYLARLMPQETEVPMEPMPPPTLPVVPAELQAPDSMPLILVILQAILFWSVFGALIVFVFRQYLLRNSALLRWLNSLPVWRWFGEAWGWLRGLWRQGWLGEIRQAAAAALRRLSRSSEALIGAAGVPGLRLRRLSARQRLIFYYLALLRRAGEQGLPRRPDETPLEYARRLEVALPEKLETAAVVEADVPQSAEGQAVALTEAVETLTGSFQEARYTIHAVEAEQVEEAQGAWGHLRKALQKYKRK